MKWHGLFIQNLERLLSENSQAVGGRREPLQVSAESRSNERQNRTVRLKEFLNGAGIVVRERLPGKLADTLLIRGHFPTCREQGLQFFGMQLSEPAKAGTAGERFGTDQTQSCFAEVPRRIPIEVIEKIRLTKQIKLK